MSWRHLELTLFPYTTLFRSWPRATAVARFSLSTDASSKTRPCVRLWKRVMKGSCLSAPSPGQFWCWRSSQNWRSEEHTSELQSRENLVCRLLLEKKKENITS